MEGASGTELGVLILACDGRSEEEEVVPIIGTSLVSLILSYNYALLVLCMVFALCVSFYDYSYVALVLFSFVV